MTDPLVQFRGQAWDELDGVYLELARGFLAAPTSRGTDYITARRAGRLSGNRVADVLTIVANGYVTGDTAEEWQVNRTALMAVLDENGKEPGLLLVRPPYLGLDVAGGNAWILARVKNYVEGEINAERKQPFSVELESVTPYWSRDVPPEVPTEHTLVVATDTSWRTMDIKVDGIDTNAEPSGWKIPGFDDSAAPWGNAITGAGSVAYFDIAGADKISDDAVGTLQDTETGHGTWLARRTFELPAIPSVDPVLHVNCDNTLLGAWINGVLLGTLPNGNWSTDHTFTIDAADLVEGENVLAVKVDCDPAPGESMAQASVAITYTA